MAVTRSWKGPVKPQRKPALFANVKKVTKQPAQKQVAKGTKVKKQASRSIPYESAMTIGEPEVTETAVTEAAVTLTPTVTEAPKAIEAATAGSATSAPIEIERRFQSPSETSETDSKSDEDLEGKYDREDVKQKANKRLAEILQEARLNVTEIM